MINTATVSIAVSVGGVQKVFTASGETDGSVYRLAENLVGTARGDARRWLMDQTYEAGRLAREAGQLGLPSVD